MKISLIKRLGVNISGFSYIKIPGTPSELFDSDFRKSKFEKNENNVFELISQQSGAVVCAILQFVFLTLRGHNKNKQ